LQRERNVIEMQAGVAEWQTRWTQKADEALAEISTHLVLQ